MVRTLRSWSFIALSLAIVIGLPSQAIARSDGTPSAKTPAAGGVDCAVLYRGLLPADAAPGSACVNVVTGSPDAPAVDVYVDDVKIVTNQEYAASVLNHVFAVPSGKPEVRVVLSGEAPDKALLAKKISLAPGGAYDLVLWDVAASMKVRAYLVDNSALPADGSRARIISATADQGTIVGYLVQGPRGIADAVATKPIEVGRRSSYLNQTWTDADHDALTVYEGPEGTTPDNDTGHASGGAPGSAYSFILVAQDGRFGTWVTTRWAVIGT